MEPGIPATDLLLEWSFCHLRERVLILLNDRCELAEVSDAFTLSGEDIEFCCGLARENGSDRLLISYGVYNNQALLAAVRLENVLRRIATIT